MPAGTETFVGVKGSVSDAGAAMSDAGAAMRDKFKNIKFGFGKKK